MRFKLGKERFNDLKLLVKQRDRELWNVYERILGIPFPTEELEVHHVIPVADSGPDKEDNLLTLNYHEHRFIFHITFGAVDKHWQVKAQQYLRCREVKQWRRQHKEELEIIYGTEEREKIKKKRNGCLPKKPKWAAF